MVLSQKLNRAEGTFVILHNLPLGDRALGSLEHGLLHAGGTFCVLDSELDKTDALTDEPRET